MKEITLSVSFDIDQESERLNWQFLGQDGKPIHKKTGMETGLFVFEKNYIVSLQVTVESFKNRLESAHVIDSHLMTRPILHSKRAQPKYAGEYPYPSPFFNPATWIEGQGATINFGTGAATGDRSKMSWTSPTNLRCLNEGRWETSYIMTVAVSGIGEDLQYRVFSLDPETEVGTGAVP